MTAKDAVIRQISTELAKVFKNGVRATKIGDGTVSITDKNDKEGTARTEVIKMFNKLRTLIPLTSNNDPLFSLVWRVIMLPYVNADEASRNKAIVDIYFTLALLLEVLDGVSKGGD